MRPAGRNLLALFVSVAIGAVLVWGTLVMPPFGTADAVIHHMSPALPRRFDQGNRRP